MDGLIGSGTYGEVYKVTNSTGLQKAVKIINRPKRALDYQDIAREIYGLYNSGHLEHILFGHQNRVGLSMPLLGRRLGNSVVPKINVLESVALLRPVAEALKDLKGMHRDVKPANILWPKDLGHRSTLIDFSLSTYMTKSKDHAVVTLWYRAPEILLKMDYTNAIDVWSLGIILLNVLTGAHVSRILDEDQTLFMLLNLLDAFGWPNDWPEFSTHMTKLFQHHMPTRGPSCGTYDILKAIADNNPMHHAKLAEDLLKGMLQINPSKRLTWPQVLEHPFWQLEGLSCLRSPLVTEALDVTANHFVNHALRVPAMAKQDVSIWATPEYLRQSGMLKQRVFEVDYLLHYGKKMGFSEDTCIMAYFLNVKCIQSDLKFVERLAACLFLASAFNEDARVDPLDFIAWSVLWDEPPGFTMEDAIIGVLKATAGYWPNCLEAYKASVLNGQWPKWMTPFMCIFQQSEFQDAALYLDAMVQECATNISNRF